MSKKLLMRSLLAIGVIFAIGLIGTTNETGGAPAVLSKDNPAVRVVMKAQDRHSAKLMSIKGVVGTATGLTQDGELAIIVYTKSDISRAIPNRLDNIPVRVKVTGEIFALNKPIDGQHDHGDGGGGEDPGTKGKKTNTTVRFERPVPIGVSISGEPSCIAGSIAARLTDGSGNFFALSNNHVIAEENEGMENETILLQPGLFDTNCDLDLENNVIGILSAFQKIIFGGVISNDMDAAIASTTTDLLDNATPADGYGVPSSITVDAEIGQDVQKYGRTTNLTKGTVTGLNASIMVIYNAGTALFIKQIVVESKKPFIKLGDSGALVVTTAGANPIGLIFAGDERGKMAFANRIDPILSKFGLMIDGM